MLAALRPGGVAAGERPGREPAPSPGGAERGDDDESEAEADADAGEEGEDWERPGEMGMPNRWLFGPPPKVAAFGADDHPELARLDPSGATDAPAGGRLRGALELSVSPSSLSGPPRRLARPGAGGISSFGGQESFSAGVSLAGPLSPGRLAFSFSLRPEWRRRRERLVLSAEDQAFDLASAENANRDLALGWRRDARFSLQFAWTPRPGRSLRARLFGAPAAQSGTIRAPGRRLSPENDWGAPADAGTGLPPLSGAQGGRRMDDFGAALDYRGAFSPRAGWEARAAWHRARSVETPDAGAEHTLFIDLRRPQLDQYRAMNGLLPLTTPAQYRFGGLGWYDGGSEARTLAARLAFTREFGATGGRHRLKYGLDYADRRVRENALNSGPRGDGGRLASIYTSFFDWSRGVARLRAGAYAEMSCAYPDPGAGGFAAACPNTIYSLVRAPLNPLQPLAARKTWSAFAQDEWTLGRLRLALGLRVIRTQVEQHGDYSLAGALTGEPLIGPDGNPVGTRDPDNPFESAGGEPDRPAPEGGYAPIYAAGPGRFVGGGARFRAELSPRLAASWDLDADGESRLVIGAARLYDEIPDELAHRAFSSEFGIARAGFNHPDFTEQLPGATTYGGLLHKAAPGTRLGYADHFRAGWRARTEGGLSFSLEARYRRQGRVLAETQTSAMEEIANFYYDSLIRLRQCRNCAGSSLFPDYPPVTSPAARGFLSPTLANPGDNTPAGRFGSPARRDASLSATIGRDPGPAGGLSWRIAGRIARARGNYAGVMVQTNGSGEEKFTSLFDYPLSPLTRSQYAYGPLDPDEPSALALSAGWRGRDIPGLSTELAWRWRQGSLRTPVLRSPFSAYGGTLPGITPDYFRFNRQYPGYTDLLVLRGYTPVERGAWGRNPSAQTLDASLAWRRPLGRGALAIRLSVVNLLNRTGPLSYEDALEPEAGYPDPVSSGPSGELRGAPPTGAGAQRGPAANPVFGLPATVQLPRRVTLGLEWSF